MLFCAAAAIRIRRRFPGVSKPLSRHQKANTMTKSLWMSVLAVIGLACLTSSHAATVIWGTAQNISGDSDVANNGTFNRAYVFGNVTWTVNGVTFGAFTGNVSGDTMSFPNQDGGFGAGAPESPYGSLSTEYQNLLYYGAWAYPSATASFTLNGLTIGDSYQVQVFANDSRSAGFGRSMALTGSSTVLDYNTTEAVGGVGQFAIGTFTANSTSQMLGFSSSTETPQLNGLSLRVTAYGNYTWNNAAGNMTWNTSSTNWTAGGSGRVWENPKAATLGAAGAGTITVAGTNTVNGLTVTADGYTLSGGQINLGLASTILAISNSAAIESVVGGTNSLVKTGTGTLVLSGNNSYSGGTLISNGTLSISADTNLGAVPAWPSPGNVTFDLGKLLVTESFTLNSSRGLAMGAFGGTIEVAAGKSFAYEGVAAGAGGLTKSGNGALTLSGANTYTGATIVDQGTLELAFSGNSNAGVGTIAVGSDITVNAGGTLLGSAGNALGFGTAHTVGGTTDQLTINEGGQLRVGAGTVLSMPYALNVVGGTISSVDGGHPSFGTIFYGSTEGTFTSSSGGTAATISAQNFNLQGASFNVVQGGGPVDLSVTSNLIGNALTKNGNGVMVLSGNNTYSGATTVTGGVLNLNSSAGSSLGSTASVSVSTNATLLISQSGQVNNSAAVTLSGGTIRRGGDVSEVFGDLNVSAPSFLDFGAANSAGSLRFGAYTESALLTVQNFLPGNKLQFASGFNSALLPTGGSLSNENFSFSNGFTTGDEDGYFTITAIPEPSTIAAAIGLVGVLLWPGICRAFKDSIRGNWPRTVC